MGWKISKVCISLVRFRSWWIYVVYNFRSLGHRHRFPALKRRVAAPSCSSRNKACLDGGNMERSLIIGRILRLGLYPLPVTLANEGWILITNLGVGNSKILYFHPENWGNDPTWLLFFRYGLVQTTKLATLDEGNQQESHHKSWLKLGSWWKSWYFLWLDRTKQHEIEDDLKGLTCWLPWHF